MTVTTLRPCDKSITSIGEIEMYKTTTSKVIENPLAQLEEETDKAYQYFVCYAEMGPDRSIEKVRQNYGKSTAYRRHLEKWSSENGWVERANQYDRWKVQQSIAVQSFVKDRITAKLLEGADEFAKRLLYLATSDQVKPSEQHEYMLTYLNMIGFDMEGEEKKKSGGDSYYMQTFQQVISDSRKFE